jgi:cobalamin biosynthesis protein CobT
MAYPGSTNNKKRPAAGSSGPQGKKPRTGAAPPSKGGNKSNNNAASKDKPIKKSVTREPKKPEAESKRKLPITGNVKQDDEEEDDDVDMIDGDEDEFDEDAGDMEVEGETTGEPKLDGEQAKRLSKGELNRMHICKIAFDLIDRICPISREGGLTRSTTTQNNPSPFSSSSQRYSSAYVGRRSKSRPQ